LTTLYHIYTPELITGAKGQLILIDLGQGKIVFPNLSLWPEEMFGGTENGFFILKVIISTCNA
jgi:hypothetical protein